jgi:hypothetical protein
MDLLGLVVFKFVFARDLFGQLHTIKYPTQTLVGGYAFRAAAFVAET